MRTVSSDDDEASSCTPPPDTTADWESIPNGHPLEIKLRRRAAVRHSVPFQWEAQWADEEDEDEEDEDEDDDEEDQDEDEDD